MVEVRTLLRHIGARTGISIGLIAVVIAVVVVARVLPHTDAPPMLSNGAAAGTAAPITLPPAPSPSPAVPLLHSPEPPRVKAGTRSPQSIARSFALAWLDHDGVSAATWLHGVTAFSTASLTAQLAEADPANVPANRIIKDLTVVDNTPDNCLVNVPMDTGTLQLTLAATGGNWLVSDVDWTGDVS